MGAAIYNIYQVRETHPKTGIAISWWNWKWKVECRTGELGAGLIYYGLWHRHRAYAWPL